jgi:hypothetical protein
MFKIFIANNAAALATLKPQHTVEAEFGFDVVEGSVQTLAHHGPRAANPCPCLNPDVLPAERGDVIGISHIDLDTLGGLGRIIGIDHCMGFVTQFWALAAYVDINGPHKIHEFAPTPETERQLNAYWAWAADHKVFAPRDGSVLDVSHDVATHMQELGHILAGDEGLLEAGDAFKAAGAELNKTSLVEVIETPLGKVAIRRADGFTNHLYTTAEEVVCDGVLAFNATFESVTLSFSDGQGNACDIMQKAFGPEAGGHAGIAGSPRTPHTFDDLGKVIEQLNGWLAVTT